MDGKVREGFVDWMILENVFNIPINFMWTKEEYAKAMRDGSIMGFYNASDNVKEALYSRFDKLRETICK